MERFVQIPDHHKFDPNNPRITRRGFGKKVLSMFASGVALSVGGAAFVAYANHNEGITDAEIDKNRPSKQEASEARGILYQAEQRRGDIFSKLGSSPSEQQIAAARKIDTAATLARNAEENADTLATNESVAGGMSILASFLPFIAATLDMNFEDRKEIIVTSLEEQRAVQDILNKRNK